MAQIGGDLVDASDGVGIGGAHVAFHTHVGDDNEAVAHMVKDDDVVGKEQGHVGNVELAFGGGREAFHKNAPCHRQK